jgi:hypothetical protein
VALVAVPVHRQRLLTVMLVVAVLVFWEKAHLALQDPVTYLAALAVLVAQTGQMVTLAVPVKAVTFQAPGVQAGRMEAVAVLAEVRHLLLLAVP